MPPPITSFGHDQIAKVHAAIREQLFTPSGGRGGKRKKSEEAKAAITAISKALSKMDHPKGSGLLEVGDMKAVVSRDQKKKFIFTAVWQGCEMANYMCSL